MNKELASVDELPAKALRVLVCDITGNSVQPSSPDEEWVFNPLQCLEKAVEGKPGIIVIRFGETSIRQREVLVELSAALKRNSHTEKYPVLALLHSKHRKLIEDLQRAKVDYVRYTSPGRLDSSQMREITYRLGPNDRLKRHLLLLCPFLHYGQIDSRHEITVCGAYLDRMALGGRRLREICHTGEHLRCDYYLNPRQTV